MYGIYDMENYEQCVAVFDTVKDVAKFFNTTPNCISTAIHRKQLRENRYLIEKIKE